MKKLIKVSLYFIVGAFLACHSPEPVIRDLDISIIGMFNKENLTVIANDSFISITSDTGEAFISSITIDSVDVVYYWYCTKFDSIQFIGNGKFIIQQGGAIQFQAY